MAARRSALQPTWRAVNVAFTDDHSDDSLLTTSTRVSNALLIDSSRIDALELLARATNDEGQTLESDDVWDEALLEILDVSIECESHTRRANMELVFRTQPVVFALYASGICG